MYEVELKVSADHDSVRGHLDSQDASHVESVTQEDTYYNAPDRDFVETDEALRVRRETLDDGSERTAVTYKGPLVDDHSKTRREAETTVADDQAMDEILTGLGYEATATVTKHRDQFELDGCVVTLDAVEGLGEYVEVELETEQDLDAESGATLASLRDEAAAVLRKLELDPADQIRTSYLDLLLDADRTP
jgi:adenylate cyclase class 2